MKFFEASYPPNTKCNTCDPQKALPWTRPRAVGVDWGKLCHSMCSADPLKTKTFKNKKVQRGYNLAICRAGPGKAAAMIFGMVGPLVDVITSAKLGVDRFVVSVPRGGKFGGFPFESQTAFNTVAIASYR